MYGRMNQDTTKRVLLPHHSYHIIAPSHSPDATAPSLHHRIGVNDAPNPTLLPTPLLQAFQYIFLIRKPVFSIPSLYRCFIPPLSEATGLHSLDPTEIGYRELRILFNYLYPHAAENFGNDILVDGESDKLPILIDADDLLSHPEFIIYTVCSRLGIPYSSSMLSWASPEDHALAKSAFGKYDGYHEDALNSTGLRPQTANQERRPKQAKTRKEEDQEWAEEYGDEAAQTIRNAVDLCQADYEYLRQFRIKPNDKTS